MTEPRMEAGAWPQPGPAYLPPVAPRRGSPALIVAIVLLVPSVVGSATALVAFGVLGEVKADPELVACHEDARAALREFQTLDDELDDGLKYFEYQVLMERVKDALDDLEVAMPARLDDEASYAALSRALGSYRAAEEAWSSNIDCTYCASEDVEPTLQDHWSDASLEVGNAASVLEGS